MNILIKSFFLFLCGSAYLQAADFPNDKEGQAHKNPTAHLLPEYQQIKVSAVSREPERNTKQAFNSQEFPILTEELVQNNRDLFEYPLPYLLWGGEEYSKDLNLNNILKAGIRAGDKHFKIVGLRYFTKMFQDEMGVGVDNPQTIYGYLREYQAFPLLPEEDTLSWNGHSHGRLDRCLYIFNKYRTEEENSLTRFELCLEK